MRDSRLSGHYKIVHQKHELRVGVLMLLAVVFMMLALLWSRGMLGGGRDTVSATVSFSGADGLTPGDPVLMAGVTVGRVREVRLTGPDRVIVVLDVDAAWRPRRDAWAAIEPLDLMGSRYLMYRPGGAIEVLEAGAEIASRAASPLAAAVTDLRHHGAELAFRAQDFLTTALAAELRATFAAIDRARVAAGDADLVPLLADAEAGVEGARSAAVRLDSLLEQPASDAGERATALRASAREMSAGLGTATAALDRILAHLDSGQGTLGRLQGDTILRAQVTRIRETIRRVRQ